MRTQRLNKISSKGAWMCLSWQSTCVASTKPCVQFSARYKLSVVAHVYSPSIWKMEAEGSEVQGYPQLHIYSFLVCMCTPLSLLTFLYNTRSVISSCPVFCLCCLFFLCFSCHVDHWGYLAHFILGSMDSNCWRNDRCLADQLLCTINYRSSKSKSTCT